MANAGAPRHLPRLHMAATAHCRTYTPLSLSLSLPSPFGAVVCVHTAHIFAMVPALAYAAAHDEGGSSPSWTTTQAAPPAPTARVADQVDEQRATLRRPPPPGRPGSARCSVTTVDDRRAGSEPKGAGGRDVADPFGKDPR